MTQRLNGSEFGNHMRRTCQAAGSSDGMADQCEGTERLLASGQRVLAERVRALLRERAIADTESLEGLVAGAQGRQADPRNLIVAPEQAPAIYHPAGRSNPSGRLSGRK
jgi:hypothetical protein